MESSEAEYLKVFGFLNNPTNLGRIFSLDEVATDTALLTVYIKRYIDNNRGEKGLVDVTFSNDYLKIKIDPSCSN